MKLSHIWMKTNIYIIFHLNQAAFINLGIDIATHYDESAVADGKKRKSVKQGTKKRTKKAEKLRLDGDQSTGKYLAFLIGQQGLSYS